MPPATGALHGKSRAHCTRNPTSAFHRGGALRVAPELLSPPVPSPAMGRSGPQFPAKRWFSLVSLENKPFPSETPVTARNPCSFPRVADCRTLDSMRIHWHTVQSRKQKGFRTLSPIRPVSRWFRVESEESADNPNSAETLRFQENTPVRTNPNGRCYETVRLFSSFPASFPACAAPHGRRAPRGAPRPQWPPSGPHAAPARVLHRPRVLYSVP